MVRSSIRQTPAARRDPVAAAVAALVEARGGNGDDYRTALVLLAAPQAQAERDKLRRTLLTACFVVGVALLAAALWSGIDTVYAVSAAAFLAALVGHCIWFQDWS